MNDDRKIQEKATELRALMAVTHDSKSPTMLVLDALIEATLKQQEGAPLGSVEVPEEGLIDFLTLAGEQARAEQRLALRDARDGRPAEPLFQAFEEIVRDEKVLYDRELDGYVDAAVYADLARQNTGSFEINVGLTQIDAAQLAFVLDVARRYELDAREERGYLCLRPHLIPTEEDALEPEPEAVEA